jgi:hypothetical protein
MPLKRECQVPSSDVTIQLGRPQSLDPRFTEGIQRFCQQSPQIAACYILDARRPSTGELTMIIAVTLDDEAKQLDRVIDQLKAILPDLPSQAERTMIMGATPLLLSYAGEEFYLRPAG